MKICAAQSRPVTGDVAANVQAHVEMIEAAVAQAAELVVFPELSLTGYEPALAQALAVDFMDSRLDVFQQLADRHGVALCVGAPTRAANGVCISMLVFQPAAARQVYSKQYLHADEEPFFQSGKDGVGLLRGCVAPVICYELSVPQHAAAAANRGAQIYMASVAKVARNIQPAMTRLGVIAHDYGMQVVMANAVGMADGELCCGGSAAWNRQGEMLVQLDDTREGLLLFDTDTQQARAVYM